MNRECVNAIARSAGNAAITIAAFGLAMVASAYVARAANEWFESRETSRSDETANANRARLLKLLVSRGRSVAEAERLASQRPTKHELQILSEVVFPDELHTSFADIGGHHKLKRDLYEAIILPLQNPALFRELHAASSLLSLPGGVLFYGPPGTGKTLMARSIAQASGATFINVRPSTMQSKWFGESQKLVRAIFSVAQQYAPSIVFIDECDSFMRKRGSSFEHEANSTMRSEFLSLWDGLLSRNSAAAADAAKDGAAGGEVNSSVMVLACSNRPFDIDEAFLRRMPRSFLLPLPSDAERIDILTLLLRDQAVGRDSEERASLIQQLGTLTADYSGSDLKELCRVAAALPVRALLAKHTRQNFEQVMHGGAPSSHAAAAAAAKHSPANSEKKKGKSKRSHRKPKGAVASGDETAGSSSDAALAAAGAAAVAALSADSSAPSASASSASSSSVSVAAATLEKPRALALSDFRVALRAVRPSGTASMRELLAFERKHRGVHDTQMAEAGDEEEEEEANSDDQRASDQDADSDSIYD